MQAKQEFFKRTENLTNSTFMEAEMQLLCKGLKYNLHQSLGTGYKHSQ
jgi:hypothetical protein